MGRAFVIFMLNVRYFIAVGVGAALALTGMAEAIAQPEQVGAAEVVQPSSPQASVSPAPVQTSTSPAPASTSPAGSSSPPAASISAKDLLPLNPNPDPLNLPSEPDQVTVTLTQPLSLSQAQELARRNNLTLQVSELQLRQSQAALRQALSSLFPNLSLQTNFARTQSPGSQFTSPNFQFQQQQQLQQFQFQQQQLQFQQQQQEAVNILQLQLSNLQQRFEGPQLISFNDQQNLELQQIINQLQLSASEAANPPTLPLFTPSPLLSTTQSITGGFGGGGGGTTTNTLTANLSLVYNLYSSGQRQASIRAGREQVRSSELAVQQQTEQLRLDVSNDYYNAQQADVQVRIAQAAVENAQINLRDTQALERAGIGTLFDVLQAQVQLANSQQNLTQALSLQRTSRRQLVQRLNISQQADISLADPVQVAGEWTLSLEETIVLALRNRAELEQLLAQRNIAVQNRRIALSNLGPSVNLFASFNTLDRLFDDFTPRYGYSVGLQVNWTFFDGGSARASAAQQEANIAIAETEFANTKNQIRFQVERAYFTLQANLQNIQTARTAVTQATEGLRLARLRFQAGVGTQADVTDAQTNLTQAQGNLLAATLNYNRALAVLERAVGYTITVTPARQS
uniref:Outer membrane efflux protein n=1 Tax=Cyanothece sp. (strain PCC 7425 / ATCC 29141) TaxID=395961 RepID=B8HRS9_CYAP4